MDLLVAEVSFVSALGASSVFRVSFIKKFKMSDRANNVPFTTDNTTLST